MDFAAYCQANGKAIANFDKSIFSLAVKDFYLKDDKAAHVHAYTRQHPNTLNGTLLGIWDGRNQQLAGQALATSLQLPIDQLYDQTIFQAGGNKLEAERLASNQHYTAGAGNTVCPTLDEYAKNGLIIVGDFKITRHHLASYASLYTLLAAPYLAKTRFNEHTLAHKRAKELADAVRALAGPHFDEKSTRWSKLIELTNYWMKEIGQVRGRQVQWDAVVNWAGGPVTEQLFRLVSVEEKDDALKTKVFARGPKSFERHKWFFFGKGKPGVAHGWLLTIDLKGPAIKTLMDNAVEVSAEAQKTTSHALLKKANELDCIGIHEDLLEKFCETMLGKITAKLNT